MFENINKFDRLFVIFTGNSINYIENDIWEKLKKECTIGINHTFKVFSPTYLFFADKDVMYAYWLWYKDKNHRPIVYARDRSLYKKPDPQRYPVLIPYEWSPKNVDEWWSLNDRLNPKEHNITPIWLMSCLLENNYKGNIYMLGADFYMEDGMYHFQNYNKDYYKNRGMSGKLELFRSYFENPFFGDKLKVFNCNPKSTLTRFPKVDLRDVVNGRL